MSNSESSPRPPRTEIFIFSYNRGQWLKTLINSIYHHISRELKCEITILDDNSTDDYTLTVLRWAESQGIRVIQTKVFGSKSHGSRGGLHVGIWAALFEIASESSMALLLQDDMQIVRDVRINDITNYKQLAEKACNPFVYANFWTGGSDYRKKVMKARHGYFIKYSPKEKRFRAYTDVCIVNVSMLRSSNLKFRPSEKGIDNEAAKLFKPMAWSPFPISGMLPNPDILRAGKKIQGQQFSFRALSSSENSEFLRRDYFLLPPIAEDFLTIKEIDLPTPWTYGGKHILFKNFLNKVNMFGKCK